MSKAALPGYGWSSASNPHMSDLLTPEVLSLLSTIKAERVLDLGSGNGYLCSKLSAAGYSVVGVEVDERGVQIAQAAHPSIPFYQYSVEEDPSDLMRTEKPFDVVVSTEVIEHLFLPICCRFTPHAS